MIGSNTPISLGVNRRACSPNLRLESECLSCPGSVRSLLPWPFDSTELSMAGRAAQIDITPLTLEELHWLMDSIVRRSLSGTLPVRHQRPFWQGQQIYVPYPPPHRNLQSEVAKGSPPNFGMGVDGLLPAAASSAMVPAQQPCSQGACTVELLVAFQWMSTSTLSRTFVTTMILRLHISNLGACHCLCALRSLNFGLLRSCLIFWLLPMAEA